MILVYGLQGLVRVPQLKHNEALTPWEDINLVPELWADPASLLEAVEIEMKVAHLRLGMCFFNLRLAKSWRGSWLGPP